MRRRIKWSEFFEDYIEQHPNNALESLSTDFDIFGYIKIQMNSSYIEIKEKYEYFNNFFNFYSNSLTNQQRLLEMSNRLLMVILDKFMSLEAISKLYKINGDVISTQISYQVRKIAVMLLFKYVDKWDKLFKAFTLEYNPIHNYDMTEQEKVGSKIIESSTGSSTSSQTLNDKESVSEDKTKTTNLGRDVNLTTTIDGNAEGKVIKSGNVEKQISAFNGGYANSEKEIYNNVTEENPYANNRSHESQTVSGSATNNKETATESTTANANDNYRQLIGTHNDTSSKTESKTTQGSKDDNVRDLTRSGNIGVTTSQQMLESEIELRRFMIEEEMIKDCIETLTLKTY